MDPNAPATGSGPYDPIRDAIRDTVRDTSGDPISDEVHDPTSDAAHDPVPDPVGDPVSASVRPKGPNTAPVRPRGPNTSAVVLGLVAMVLAALIIANEASSLRVNWSQLGPGAIVGIGFVLVVLGAVGLTRRHDDA
jgi:hypothetical protein